MENIIVYSIIIAFYTLAILFFYALGVPLKLIILIAIGTLLLMLIMKALN